MKKQWFLLMLILLIACSQKKDEVPVAFYFWRTTFTLSAIEQDYLKTLKVKKLYIRYFDVALQNKTAVPVAPIEFASKPKDYKVVPVVYIKNEVFLESSSVDTLALNMFKYIKQINKTAGIVTDEIQFDCDWSLKSKQNYFQFLESFKKLHPKISATIRLHQIKYPEKTGVPNVNSGTLMYYNMGVISAGEDNSIYSQKIAHHYIASLQNYKLPLNVALPIFSWGVHVRNNQVTNLIGGLRENELASNLFKKIGVNRYLVTKDAVFNGRYLAKNDEIKLEVITPDQLVEMVKDLKKNTKQKPNEIIFYDLNEKNLKAYEKENFKTISHW